MKTHTGGLYASFVGNERVKDDVENACVALSN